MARGAAKPRVHKAHDIPKASVQNAVKAESGLRFGAKASKEAREHLEKVVEHLGHKSVEMANMARRKTIQPEHIAEAAKMMHKDCHGVDIHKVALASAKVKHARSLPVASLRRAFQKGAGSLRMSADAEAAVWVFATQYLAHLADSAGKFASTRGLKTIQAKDIALALQL